MKITSSIKARDTVFAKNLINRNAADRKTKSSAAPVSDYGKYDTFIMTGTSEVKKPDGKANGKNAGLTMSESFKAKNAELIRELDGLSKEEKAEVAVGSYLEMQKLIKSAVQKQESKIDYFRDLESAKAYYGDLLSSGGKITDERGKYGLMDLKRGDIADREELQSAFNEIQSRIDTLIGNKTGGSDSEQSPFGNFDARIYTSYGVMFSTVTGISADCLTADGDTDLLDNIEGLTEENFIEKHTEKIGKLESRSESLKDVMTDYMKYNDYAKELFKDPGKLIEKNTNKILEAQRQAKREILELEQLKEFTFAHMEKPVGDEEEKIKKPE